MATGQIIIHDTDYFKTFDKGICEDTEIKSRIAFILSKYKCFHASHAERLHMVHKRKYKNEAINKPLNIILNKLSGDNYNKLRDEVIELCNFVDTQDIISCILNYSVMRTQFSDIYIKLIFYIGTCYDNVYSFLNDYLMHFISDTWYVLKEGCGYDDFCKKKYSHNAIINKIKAVIYIVKYDKKHKLHYNIDDLSEYCIILYNKLEHSIAEILDDDDNNSINIIQDRNNTYELYLDFLINIIPHNRIYFVKISEQINTMIYKDIIAKVNEGKLLKKIKFKAMDIEDSLLA